MAESAAGENKKAQQSSGRSQRRMRNYLLDLRYQLKFTLTMVGLAAVLTSALGYVILKKAHEASRVVQVRALDPTDELAQQLVQQFERNDRLLVFLLIGFGVLLSVVLTAYGIVLTHKVAGPLFKVTLYLDKIRDGKLGQVYNLRKGDELVEFFEHFKAAHDTLRRQEQEDIVLLEKAATQLNDPALKQEIAQAVAKKVESLK
jgi:nitrogen fixation/metabolism regulation signal transduction histidine kinase